MPGGSSSLLSSLPLGLIMFGGTAFALLRRKWNRRRAAQDFPSLARDLGLELTPPRYAGAAGTLTGKYAERVVRIDPDDQRLLKVRFHGTPRIDLRSYEHTAAAPFDMITVYSRDRAFDRFFRTRYAAEAIARRLVEAPRLAGYVQAFQGSYARHIQSVTITAEGVVCRFDSLPAAAVRDLLPACAALADLIEPSGAAAVSEPPPAKSAVPEAAPVEAAGGGARAEAERG
jgi:hypothetical protein